LVIVAERGNARLNQAATKASLQQARFNRLSPAQPMAYFQAIGYLTNQRRTYVILATPPFSSGPPINVNLYWFTERQFLWNNSQQS
jgi:hypothetical protein